MTTKDAIKHLSHKIDYAMQCDDKYADSVNIYALSIAVRAMEKELDGTHTHTTFVELPDLVCCKDCKYCEEIDNGFYICHNDNIMIVGDYLDKDWFCADGARKETDDERNTNLL